MHLLEDFHLGEEGGLSASTSEPDSIITEGREYRIERNKQEAIWEEVETVISTDSNITFNIPALMAMAGVITTVGIATSAIHVVIGGMLVAPGFMPVMRITLGIVNGNRYWYRGVVDTLKGYAALLAGAAFATFLLRWARTDPLTPADEYYQVHTTLVEYWTTVSPADILSSAATTVVGIFMLVTKRTIFTSGVMIALALIPSASLLAIGLISGAFELAGKAGVRFALDLSLILTLSLVIFSWKQRRIHRRKITS